MKRSLLYLLLCMLMPIVLIAQRKKKEERESDRDGGPGRALLFEINRTKDPATGKVPPGRYLQALQRTIELKNEAAASRAAGTLGFSWIERGPTSDVPGPSNGNTRANSGLASGRIRAVMVDSTDATKKTVFVGGVNGGIWKTTDITATTPTWTLVSDFFSNMAIAAICQDPRPGFQNIMYCCTGESYYNVDAVQGNGVFKSTDGGANWTYLASTSSYVNGTRILCDYQGNIYLATRGTGLLRSTAASGGAAWTNITPSGVNSDICDLEISSTSGPGRLHMVFGIFSTQAYRFTDNPATVTAGTWTSPTTAFPSYAMRCEIACSGNTLYALPANASYQVPTIYKSTDGGANWAATAAQPTSGWASGQGWYSLAVDIDPSNANNCIVGGLDNWKTTNGGTSWSQISTWVGTTPVNQYVHADQHKIVWYDGGNKLIFASDGGIFYSSDKGTTIRDRNLGLRVKQFYSCAMHPSTTNYFLAGAQDNGVHQFNNAGLSNTIEVTGGDGAYVAIDQNEPQYQFGSYVYNVYRRSTNSGASWTSVSLNTTSGQFINPFDYDNSGNIMYCGDNAGLYRRWTNPQTGSTSATVSITGFNSASVTAVAVSPFTANRVFFGTSGGRVVRVDGANTIASGSAGTNLSTGLPSGYINCINFGTTENNLITTYTNYGLAGNVQVSTNGGTSWTNVEGNLPDMPVRWAMFWPGDNTKAIIATETGVWQTALLNGASTVWVAESTFPNVRVDMIKYRSSDNTIAAATHGRGLWTTTVLNCTPPIVAVSPTSSNYCSPGGTPITLTASGAVTYSWSPAAGLSATTGSVVTANPSTTTVYTVTGTDGSGCQAAATTTVNVGVQPVVSPTAAPPSVCTGGSSVLSANASNSLSYCSTTYANGTGFGDYINQVSIPSTTLTNTSGASGSPYYTLFPASGSTTATLAANVAYTVNVVGGSYSTCLIRGWIDYNQDGVFSASESFGVSPNVGSLTSGTIPLTIPLTAYSGTTRMRLRSSDTSPGPGTGEACDATNSTYGETEDYVITITGGANQFNYSWSPPTFLSSTTLPVTNATGITSSTTYTVTVTNPANGCSNSNIVSVLVNPLPVVSFTGLASSYCTTDPIVSLTGSPSGGTFSGPGITGNNFNPAAAGVGGPYNITYSYTDGNGCTGTQTKSVTVNTCASFTTLNLTLFLEGFYIGSGVMRTTRYDLGLTADPNETDSIMVELWSPSGLLNPLPAYTNYAKLSKFGQAAVQFPAAVSGNSFYIAIKSRNHMETWSKTAIPFTTTTAYDFSTGLIKAFDDGINPPMAAVGGGIYAFYGGTVNADYTIDGQDASEIEINANQFLFGYDITDVNGDGATDGQDASVVEINANLFLFRARP